MNPNSQAQAILLLTVAFEKSGNSAAKPLSVKEWARFAVWLRDHDLEPSALLKGDIKTLLSGWMDRSINLPRLENLMGRGGALGFALEKWHRAGLWVVTRSDPAYPERLKRRLKLASPPVLFGCGNQRLLDRGGIAVVGSRDADSDDIAFAERLGGIAAKQGHSIVSGGARGIDESAMLGALRNEGTVIGVMAENLLRATTSQKYRKYLQAGDLVLVTPFNPEAGFSVGNAMSRNKYIYCLADAAVAVSSTPNKGGTWHGAVEALRAAWVPLWVKRSASGKSGNAELARKGACWIPDDLDSLDHLLTGSSEGTDRDGRANPPPPAAEVTPQKAAGAPVDASVSPDRKSESAKAPMEMTGNGAPVAGTDPVHDTDSYSLFLDKMHDITGEGPVTADDIAVRFGVGKTQIHVWLKQGVTDGKIRKLTRPVRYQSISGPSQDPTLFDRK